jgi:anthranilate phosphoribosyltransferase
VTADDDWPLSRLLTAVVGSGPNSADDMTAAQAAAAMARVLDRRADPTTLGAFLLANRWKRNTPTELAAFVDVMRERSVVTSEPEADPVDCGANYDGKTETALLGVGAGLVAAAAGTPVVVHSGDRVPATAGVAYRHVLAELGVETALSPAESAAMVDRTGFGFYSQARCNPGVHALLDRREAMGVRTFLNTIETLANPASADVHLGSFFHRSFAERIVETVRESRTLDVERVVMVQGLEGYDDVRPGRTGVAEWDGADVETRTVETATLGLDCERAALAVDDVAVDSARIVEAVLAGERDDAFADAVALGAAFRIYAGGDAPTLSAALERARDALASGAGADRLERLRSFPAAIDA